MVGRIAGVALAILAAAPGVVYAQAPPNFAAVLVATTPAYRPPGGPWDGFQHDFSASLGYGRFVSKTVALELDLGPTWVRGDYTAFALIPGVVWSFDPHAYAAARFIVPLDPELNLALAPGIGLTHAFANGLSPYLEVNAVSYLGRGDPDLAVGVTLGVLYSF